MNAPDATSVERIVTKAGQLLALVVRRTFKASGVHFVSEPSAMQQLAMMLRPTGEYIQAHHHLPFVRQITGTSEVLIIRRGKLRTDLFTTEGTYFCSTILEAGDVVVLMDGGHAFKVLEEVEMIEIKQGPYVDGRDKAKFSPGAYEVTWTNE